jgi:hypothetical protein
LRKDITTQEEQIEELERGKLNSERIRKKLEGELEDLKVRYFGGLARITNSKL